MSVILWDFCFKNWFQENEVFDKNIYYVRSILDEWFQRSNQAYLFSLHISG